MNRVNSFLHAHPRLLQATRFVRSGHRYYFKTLIIYQLTKFMTVVAPVERQSSWGARFRGPRSIYEYSWNPNGGLDVYESIQSSQPTGVCIDVGAWIGVYSLFMARTARRVVSLEPDKQNVQFLRKNIKLNNANNVEVIQAALDDKDGEIKLCIAEATAGHSLVAWDSAYGYKVKTISLNTLLLNLLTDKEIDLIKMDVQGAEYRILQTTSDEVFKRVKYWVVECHTDGSDKHERQSQKFMESIFQRHGYQFRWTQPIGKINNNLIYAYK